MTNTTITKNGNTYNIYVGNLPLCEVTTKADLETVREYFQLILNQELEKTQRAVMRRTARKFQNVVKNLAAYL